MDMQGVQRVADLMGHTRRKQSERLHALALDSLECLLPCLGGIMNDQRHAAAPSGFTIQWRSIQPQETRARIMHFEFMPHHAFASGAIKLFDFFPLESRDEIGDRPTLRTGLKTKKSSDRLIEVENMPAFIDNQNTVFNRVEKRFEKTALTRQSLNDGLQPFGIEPPDSVEHLIKKAGLNGHSRDQSQCGQAANGPGKDAFHRVPLLFKDYLTDAVERVLTRFDGSSGHKHSPRTTF